MRKIIIVIVILIILSVTSNGFNFGLTASDMMKIHYDTKMEYTKLGLHYSQTYFIK